MSDVGGDAEILRDFNRFYTAAIGVLEDDYLGRPRPLAQSRMLFEIGSAGAEVRELRLRLGLDSGYLSRLLRSLESGGFVCTSASAGDARVRVARLTARGRREVEALDRRASAVATRLLEPLSCQHRGEVVAAMDLIKRRLRVATITLAVVDPRTPDARRCARAYAEELALRFDGGFDGSSLVDPAAARAPRGAFVLARERDRAIGCGVVATLEPGVGELKHVWVEPGARGLGVARRLVAELERIACERGDRLLRLDTNATLTEAIALYRSLGYRSIRRYNDNPYAQLWFEKTLAA